MTASTKLATSMLFVLFLSSCLNPRLTRWHHSAEWQPTEADSPALPTTRGVTVTAFASAPGATSSASRTVVDLDAQGQAALIGEIAELLGDKASPELLLATLAKPLRSAPSAAAVEARHRVRTQLVVSLDSLPGPPADRFSRVDLILTPQQADRFRFVSWDKIETQHATVDLGKVTGTQENTFTFGTDIELPKTAEIEGASAEAKLARQLTEEVSLRSRYRVYSGSLLPHRARLVRDGALGIDLTGNTVFTLTVEAKTTDRVRVFAISGYRADNAWQNGDDLRLRTSSVIFPESADPFTIDVRAEYVLRTVGKGARTQLEGDDRVTFRREYAKTDATLVDAPDLRHVFWVVLCDGNVLHLQDPTSKVLDTMVFDSAEEADAFRAWARAKPGERSVAGRRLVYPGPPPVSADLSKSLAVQEYKRNFKLDG